MVRPADLGDVEMRAGASPDASPRTPATRPMAAGHVHWFTSNGPLRPDDTCPGCGMTYRAVAAALDGGGE